MLPDVIAEKLNCAAVNANHQLLYTDAERRFEIATLTATNHVPPTCLVVDSIDSCTQD